jgi:hypothetical protein
MQEVLTEAKRRTGVILEALATLVPQHRLAIIGYRDHGDEYVVRHSPLDQNRFRALLFLQNLQVGGGGDQPEAVYDALEFAINDLDWTPGARRVIILVGDAPPHSHNMVPLKKLVTTFRHHKGTVHTVDTGAKPGRPVMRDFWSIANAGGGEAVPLSNESKISEEILILVFGREWSAQVKNRIQDPTSANPIKEQMLQKYTTDSRWLLQKFRKSPLYPGLIRVLLSHKPVDVVPELLDLATDVTLAENNRWGALYVACQLLRTSVDPTEFETRPKKTLDKLRRLAPSKRRR